MASISISSGYSTSTRRALSATAARRLALTAAFVLLFALVSTRVYPDGGHDARSLWTLRARMIAGQGFVFAYTELDHLPMPDYPPLVPIVTAAGYRLFGFDVPVPQLVQAGVFAALLWLTSRRLCVGLLVGAVGLHYAPMLYADVPLALLLVLAVIAHQRGRYSLAGVALGLATLTKNEGVFMLVAYLVVSTLWNRRIPFAVLRGTFVPVLMLLLFKAMVSAPTELVARDGILERLMDASRYRVMLETIPALTVRFGVGALLLLPVLLRPRLSVPLLTIALVWSGYMLIYLITPYEQVWHINTSYERLLFHLFPALLVGLTTQTGNQRGLHTTP